MVRRRLPRRPAAVAGIEHSRGAFLGALDGATSVPQPVGEDGVKSDADSAPQIYFYQDEFVCSGGPQTFILTYLPILHSEKVYWLPKQSPNSNPVNNALGYYLRETEMWSRTSGKNEFMLLSEINAGPGDIIVVEYAYYAGPASGGIDKMWFNSISGLELYSNYPFTYDNPDPAEIPFITYDGFGTDRSHNIAPAMGAYSSDTISAGPNRFVLWSDLLFGIKAENVNYAHSTFGYFSVSWSPAELETGNYNAISASGIGGRFGPSDWNGGDKPYDSYQGTILELFTSFACHVRGADLLYVLYDVITEDTAGQPNTDSIYRSLWSTTDPLKEVTKTLLESGLSAGMWVGFAESFGPTIPHQYVFEISTVRDEPYKFRIVDVSSGALVEVDSILMGDYDEVIGFWPTEQCVLISHYDWTSAILLGLSGGTITKYPNGPSTAWDISVIDGSTPWAKQHTGHVCSTDDDTFYVGGDNFNSNRQQKILSVKLDRANFTDSSISPVIVKEHGQPIDLEAYTEWPAVSSHRKSATDWVVCCHSEGYNVNGDDLYTTRTAVRTSHGSADVYDTELITTAYGTEWSSQRNAFVIINRDDSRFGILPEWKDLWIDETSDPDHDTQFQFMYLDYGQ